MQNLETQQDTPTYRPWYWYGIDNRKAAVNRLERARLSGFDEEALRVITYLTTSFFFLTKFYIETILITHTNNRIKGGPLLFVYFLSFIELRILIIYHTGYNRIDFSR